MRRPRWSIGCFAACLRARKLTPDGPLRLDEEEEPEPDFYLFPAHMRVNDVRGPDTLLVCEIADSSLAKDRAVKAPLYSAYGVRIYWIVDVINRVTFVHTLDAGVHGEPEIAPFDQPLAAPGIAEPLALAELLAK
jgi:Uma2 family endonuclease